MTLRSVHFQHFRGFETLPLRLKPGVNLFVGDNASGKTTLIRGVGLVLSSFFVGFSDENTRFLGLDALDFRRAETVTGMAPSQPIQISFDWLDTQAWLKKDKEKGRTLTVPLGPLTQKARLLSDSFFEGGKQVKPLPLIGSFSTKDIHSSRKIKAAPFREYKRKPSFGYYECLQGDGFLGYWSKRLLILQEANQANLEVTGVKQALLRALGEDGCGIITDIHIRHNQGRIYYQLHDGREVPTSQLSDGLIRLVNLIMDLAFRCMLLNQGLYQFEACEHTQGTVLIDEVDLHLHPSLQALVTKGLRQAFPKVQFILTSHAPLVMSSVKTSDQDGIFKLSYTTDAGYSCREVSSYGMDISSIVEGVLQVTPRDPEIEAKLTHLFGLIDSDQFSEAEQVLANLKKDFGDRLPDLAKAQTMLDFLQVADD